METIIAFLLNKFQIIIYRKSCDLKPQLYIKQNSN